MRSPLDTVWLIRSGRPELFSGGHISTGSEVDATKEFQRTSERALSTHAAPMKAEFEGFEGRSEEAEGLNEHLAPVVRT